MAKNEFGLWLKSGNGEILVYSDNRMACQHHQIVETAKNPSLAGRWRIDPLPAAVVRLQTMKGPIVINAFDDVEGAIFFVKSYLEDNEGNVHPDDVFIESPN